MAADGTAVCGKFMTKSNNQGSVYFLHIVEVYNVLFCMFYRTAIFSEMIVYESWSH